VTTRFVPSDVRIPYGPFRRKAPLTEGFRVFRGDLIEGQERSPEVPAGQKRTRNGPRPRETTTMNENAISEPVVAAIDDGVRPAAQLPFPL
jgi:hypothetical protein